MNYAEFFQVKPGSKVRLDKIGPYFAAKHASKAATDAKLEKYTRKLRGLHYLLYAEGQGRLHQPRAGRHEPPGDPGSRFQGPLQGRSGLRFPMAH